MLAPTITHAHVNAVLTHSALRIYNGCLELFVPCECVWAIILMTKLRVMSLPIVGSF